MQVSSTRKNRKTFIINFYIKLMKQQVVPAYNATLY